MISRLVTALVSPLGTALVFWLLAGLIAATARSRKARGLAKSLAVFAFAWLWLWSTPVASDALRSWLEDRAGPREISAIPAAPVVIVLGGGIAGKRPPMRPDPDLGQAADRMWYAAKLYHAGKVPLILVSGGIARAGDTNEADAMEEFLLALGVPRKAIRREDVSYNTDSNARLVAEVMRREGIPNALLVTSAMHMRRAMRNFEDAGVRVVPAPTDFEVIPRPFEFARLFPEAGALEGSANAMKEIVGHVVGR